MEFVTLLFTGIFSLIMLGGAHTQTYCRGDIADIYYPAGKEYVAYHSDCRYTKTLIKCLDCTMLIVRRSQYDKFAKSYEKLGMKPPAPRRHDVNKVFKPRKR